MSRCRMAADTMHLRKQVQSGRFSTVDEAANALLMAHMKLDTRRPHSLKELRRMIAEGLRDFDRDNYSVWDRREIEAAIEAGEESIQKHGTIDGEKSFAGRKKRRANRMRKS